MTLPDLTLWQITALVLGAAITGLAKGGFGGGLGILAVPLLANALPPDQAIGAMLPMLIAADVLAVRRHAKNRDRTHLRPLLAGAVPGVALGTLAVLLLRERDVLAEALALLVGGICLVMVAIQAYRLAGRTLPHIPAGPGPAATAGCLAGLTSMIAHAAGPIISIYLLERRLDKHALVGSSVVFFFLLNLAKVPSYLGLGLITAETLVLSAIMIPVLPLGAVLGFWAHDKIPEKPFAALIYLGAAAAAVRMIVKVIAG